MVFNSRRLRLCITVGMLVAIATFFNLASVKVCHAIDRLERVENAEQKIQRQIDTIRNACKRAREKRKVCSNLLKQLKSGAKGISRLKNAVKKSDIDGRIEKLETLRVEIAGALNEATVGQMEARKKASIKKDMAELTKQWKQTDYAIRIVNGHRSETATLIIRIKKNVKKAFENKSKESGDFRRYLLYNHLNPLDDAVASIKNVAQVGGPTPTGLIMFQEKSNPKTPKILVCEGVRTCLDKLEWILTQ